MRIGIEAQRIFRKKKHGMDIVALQLIRALQLLDTHNEYVVFVRSGPDKCLSPTANFAIVEIPGPNYVVWEQLMLPLYAQFYSLDVLHCTSNTAPLYLKMPLILTLHDIIYLQQKPSNSTNPNWYQRLGNLYRAWIVPKIATKAKHIVTVSNYEKEVILQHFGWPHLPVTTVYNGVSEHFFAPSLSPTTENSDSDIPAPYMVYIGNTDPKKNLANMLIAFETISARTSITLVIIDIDPSFVKSLIASLRLDPGIVHRMKLLPYTPHTLLKSIFERSALVVYPSLRESFGLPILEAMAAGAPVLTSKVSSMPEVGGDAAFYADPTQPQDIALKSIEILQNPSLSHDLVTKGKLRATQFRWETTAKSMLEIYSNYSLSTQNQ